MAEQVRAYFDAENPYLISRQNSFYSVPVLIDEAALDNIEELQRVFSVAREGLDAADPATIAQGRADELSTQLRMICKARKRSPKNG